MTDFQESIGQPDTGGQWDYDLLIVGSGGGAFGGAITARELLKERLTDRQLNGVAEVLEQVKQD